MKEIIELKFNLFIDNILKSQKRCSASMLINTPLIIQHGVQDE